MHSIFARISALSALLGSTLFALMFATFLSTAFLDETIPVDLGVGNVVVQVAEDFTVSNPTRNDLGRLRIDIKANVEPLFNWNVKQLFIFLAAEYKTPSNSVNQVALWDKIIRRGESYDIEYKSMKGKYPFWDDGSGLRNNENITLKFYWNIIPNAGMMPLKSSGSQVVFSFPPTYYETVQ
ncbi:Signal peptidase complex subunit 3 [Echinococcus granulosus]|uniref:Signal peptidase complex subunit 3 n=1 Tax=Echinococcus granulosus TaxID=6210 RepID=U6IYY4_ECHGR|nr:Signal peptidase complex subunit 3 [Echinococcus granulosus]EUB63593.1 Signal peptidase complex subunit 3 [Echinococcus granulosus]KAH9287132.1 Signal peptidase complex subunit 3 [Echinococcus granulosus]CDS16243.1 signal peptidase complex subunit 3 [Echinococcus granulosus]